MRAELEWWVRDQADGARTTARVRDDGLSQAFEFAAGPVALGAIGWLVDQAAGTGFLFLVIFALFGVLGTCLSFFYRYQAQTARGDEGKPWTRRTF